MDSSLKSIVVTGGGTAGHVYPILALLPFLKPCAVHFIGSSGMEKQLTRNQGVIYHEIPSVKLIRSLTPKNLAIPFRLGASIIRARQLLSQIKPAVIFSKGGYVSLPVALSSGKTPVILHESDRSLGLANKLALNKCDKLLSSFELDKLQKSQCVGSPIRQEIYLGDKDIALKQARLRQNGKPFLLIFGGSLGASKINLAVLEALQQILCHFNVIHVVGKGNMRSVAAKNYFQTEYLSNIRHFFALADFALSRGGANSLFELISLKIPTLCIPLGKESSRGDQLENAKHFENLGCIRVLSQGELDANSLVNNLLALKKCAYLLKQNMMAAKNIDGTRKIASIINSYL